MKKRPSLLTAFLFCFISQAVQAQVVPDSSLGSESSIVSPVLNREEISGGAIRGENLFHSFKSFDVGEGKEVYFMNPDGISRIFSRVTGLSASEILGTLGVSGSTDLFFINNNGIIFGPNSALDINGSLILSTADSIRFPGGKFGSDLNSNFLSPELPVSLNVTSPSAIRVENQGSEQLPSVPPSILVSTPIQYTTKPGLSLAPQNTLALIGSEIDLNGAIVHAVDGRVVIAGVSGEAIASPDQFGWNFSFNPDSQSGFGNIYLRDAAIVEATGRRSGQIDVTGKEVSLSDGATLLSANYGGDNFLGGIKVNASSLNVGADTLSSGLTSDSLFSQSINGGKGGDLTLSVDNLRIVNGGQILATATDSASAGNIQIDARNDITLDGAAPIKVFLSSAINDVTYGSGDSGDINIDTSSLQVFKGGIISTSTIGSGQAGSVNIASDRMELSGVSPIIFRPSFAGSVTTGTGNSGELKIGTQSLAISDGGAAGTTTLGSSGNASSTSIRASDSIRVVGQNISGTRSSIISNSAKTSPAVQQASEIDGALLGNAGSLSIDTPTLILRDRGFIGVQNDGTSGNAGNIFVNTGKLQLLNSADIAASTAGGQGGNIQILSQSLLAANQSSIQAAALGVGDGGNVSIDSQVAGLFNDSKISANAELGRGGQVNLTSIGLFNDSSSSITATSARGPQFDGVVNIQSPNPSLAESTVSPTTTVQYPALSLACNSRTERGQASLTISGTGGLPDVARGPLRSYSGWNENDQHSFPQLSQDAALKLQAQGWKMNPDGTYSMTTFEEAQSYSANPSGGCVLQSPNS